MYKILFAFFVLIDPIFGEKHTFFSNFGTIICIFEKNVVLLRRIQLTPELYPEVSRMQTY